MWAPSTKLLGCIAIPTENLKALWKTIQDKPAIDLSDSLLAMFITIIIDVIDSKKFLCRFSTASTLTSVTCKYLDFVPLVSLTIIFSITIKIILAVLSPLFFSLFSMRFIISLASFSVGHCHLATTHNSKRVRKLYAVSRYYIDSGKRSMIPHGGTRTCSEQTPFGNGERCCIR